MPEFLPYAGAASNFPGVGQPSTNKLVYPPRANVVVDDSIIGFVNQIDPSQTATVERIRHMNFADAGRIIEQVTAPVDFSLTVRGFVLYTSNLLGRLSGEATGKESEVELVDESGGGIIPSIEWVSARRPNIIVEFIHTGDTSKHFRIVYADCAFTNVGGTISTGDLYITETVGLQPAYIDVESNVHVADEPAPLTT